MAGHWLVCPPPWDEQPDGAFQAVERAHSLCNLSYLCYQNEVELPSQNKIQYFLLQFPY